MQPPTRQQKLQALILEKKKKREPTEALENELARLMANESEVGFASAPPAHSSKRPGTWVDVTTGPDHPGDEALFEHARSLGRT